ncbi:excinuclease ABC subunit UvrC [Ornithinimicrobium avium]|uniref:UvrABC system protein C n=1 Tax=Ornithinimicrobium avium TaxID=2283195 RepID=A0A345NJC7_9MICO|nr:excinuclease ABC subunit UvrC [Ornithinimicrobium avium]AXH95135.1 excinuclease ABC subunit UvrC [Ornithinimicrobium avium]
MADPASYRPRPGEIPAEPGVYRFRDRHGRVIYVGKAGSLRSRLSSYFQDPAALHPRTRQMVTTGASVEWTVVRNEVEALQLEYSWIKQFDPRFNVKYRDDKSYPYLAVTMGEEFPRAQVMRGSKRPGTRYFGPYTHAWAIRETLDTLLRVFPVRTCSKGVFRRAQQTGRPCLLGYIGKCSAPCVGWISPEDHRALAEDFCAFMAGDHARFVRQLEADMQAASAELDFETAARLRDDVAALKRALERSAVVLNDDTDADVYALADDELEVAVQVFLVRGGRIRGQRGWVSEKGAEDLGSVVEHLLQQVYGAEEGDEVPREVLVPVLPSGHEELEEWLGGLRGARVRVRVPQRGDKRTLMQTVARNAEQALARHKVARSGDLTLRSQALQELQDALELGEAPLRIESFDISHVQGSDMVGSMVVFEDGLARRSEYRRYVVREGTGDDTAAMHEVLTRRFRHLVRGRARAEEGRVAGEADRPAGLEETDGPDEGRDSSSTFRYPPNLVVVDGGLPQVNAAQAALTEVGVSDVTVVGLAKRLEEVWIPGQDHPVVLPRTSEGLYLLQRVRDEAHRFANTFHRQRRSRSMTASELDGIPGLGKARQQSLLARFGSVKALRRATVEQLQEVPGIGPAVATAVFTRLQGAERGVAVNLSTGEVLD